MSKTSLNRQVAWAQATREKLIRILGGRCKRCGLDTNLTFDCIVPTGGAHHKLSSVGRVTYYKREMARGNVQLLCHSCNSKKGATREPRYTVTVPLSDEFAP
jgi:5-methylcytosine-specific restriction endonuclease McrA